MTGVFAFAREETACTPHRKMNQSFFARATTGDHSHPSLLGDKFAYKHVIGSVVSGHVFSSRIEFLCSAFFLPILIPINSLHLENCRHGYIGPDRHHPLYPLSLLFNHPLPLHCFWLGSSAWALADSLGQPARLRCWKPPSYHAPSIFLLWIFSEGCHLLFSFLHQPASAGSMIKEVCYLLPLLCLSLLVTSLSTLCLPVREELVVVTPSYMIISMYSQGRNCLLLWGRRG